MEVIRNYTNIGLYKKTMTFTSQKLYIDSFNVLYVFGLYIFFLLSITAIGFLLL